MNWTNNCTRHATTFEAIKIGDVFEYNEIFYIKLSASMAFDIINNILSTNFYAYDAVYSTNHEIIITD